MPPTTGVDFDKRGAEGEEEDSNVSLIYVSTLSCTLNLTPFADKTENISPLHHHLRT